jgi:hypothetical protein
MKRGSRETEKMRPVPERSRKENGTPNIMEIETWKQGNGENEKMKWRTGS